MKTSDLIFCIEKAEEISADNQSTNKQKHLINVRSKIEDFMPSEIAEKRRKCPTKKQMERVFNNCPQIELNL